MLDSFYVFIWETKLLYYSWIILGMGSANDRRRYTVKPPLIGWAHTQNYPCYCVSIFCCVWHSIFITNFEYSLSHQSYCIGHVYIYIYTLSCRLVEDVSLCNHGIERYYNTGTWGIIHDDVIKWKHFPRYWPCVRGIHRLPVNSPHKGQWRGAWCLLWFASE